MKFTYLVFAHGFPVAAYASESDAVKAIFSLPHSMDAHVCLVSVPFNAALVVNNGTVDTAGQPGGPRVSAASGQSRLPCYL
jgi:hypothetical protein